MFSYILFPDAVHVKQLGDNVETTLYKKWWGERLSIDEIVDINSFHQLKPFGSDPQIRGTESPDHSYN